MTSYVAAGAACPQEDLQEHVGPVPEQDRFAAVRIGKLVPTQVGALPSSRAGAVCNGHATLFALADLTTNRTPTPSLASMSINASVLKRSMRPRSRSLTRGWVT